MDKKEIEKCEKRYNRYYARAKREGKLMDFVGLKGWSADSTWVSDTDSRKPTMYIPDAIRESVLGNIFVSPFILLFSGFPRASIYSILSRNQRRNYQKAQACKDRKEELLNSETENQVDSNIEERIKVVEGQREKETLNKVDAEQTAKAKSVQKDVEVVEKTTKEEVVQTKGSEDLVMGEDK